MVADDDEENHPLAGESLFVKLYGDVLGSQLSVGSGESPSWRSASFASDAIDSPDPARGKRAPWKASSPQWSPRRPEQDSSFSGDENEVMRPLRSDSPPPPPPPPSPPPSSPPWRERNGEFTPRRERGDKGRSRDAPLSPEETPITKKTKPFVELLEEQEREAERIERKGKARKEDMVNGKAKEKRPFLKKGSRNWKRVEAVEAAAVKRKSGKKPGERRETVDRENDGYFPDVIVKAPMNDVNGGEQNEKQLREGQKANWPSFSAISQENRGQFDRESAKPSFDFHDKGFDFELDDHDEFLALYNTMNPATTSPVREHSRYSFHDSKSVMKLSQLDEEEELYDIGSDGEKSEHESIEDVEEEDDLNSEPAVSNLVQRMFYTLDPKHKSPVQREQTARKVEGRNPTKQEPHGGVADGLSKKLMEELEKFQLANEKLQKSLEKIEAEKKQLENERLALEKANRDKGKAESEAMSELREEVRKERSLLQKEKSGLEKQKQHIELLRASMKMEKKEKSVVETLQATIAQLRQSESERSAKQKETLRSKRDRISTLEKEIHRLEEALQYAETRRLEAWERETTMKKQLEEVNSRCMYLEQELDRSNTDLHIAEAKVLQIENSQPPQQLIDKSSSADKRKKNKKKKKSEGTEKLEKKIKKTLNERESVIKDDGTRVTTMRNGTVKEVMPSGETTFTFMNGDIKKIIPEEGLEVYYFAETETTRTTYNDGMVVLEFASGQVERTHADKTFEVFYPDGAIRIVHPDNTEETLFPDGKKTIVHQDGSRDEIRSEILK